MNDKQQDKEVRNAIRIWRNHLPALSDEDVAKAEDALSHFWASDDDLVSLITERERLARVDELTRIPWKSVKRYSIETPYLTKKYWTRRLASLRGIAEELTALSQPRSNEG